MRSLLFGTVLVVALTGAALAQTPGQGTQQAAAQASQPSSQTQANPMTVQKLKSDLQNSGFSDVKVMAEAFVVQAETKDGNPVVMTIGPHGFSAFEAVQNSNGGSSGQASTAHSSKK